MLSEQVGICYDVEKNRTRRWVCNICAYVFRYVMLKGINDSPEDAERLGNLLKDVYCSVNLILFNPHGGTKFEASDMEVVQVFRQIVRDSGKLCTVRDSRGDDEMAACGQLGSPALARNPAPILKPPPRFRDVFGHGHSGFQTALDDNTLCTDSILPATL